MSPLFIIRGQGSVTPTPAVLNAVRSTSTACCGVVRTAPDVTSALSATVTTNTTYVTDFCVLIITKAKGKIHIQIFVGVKSNEGENKLSLYNLPHCWNDELKKKKFLFRFRSRSMLFIIHIAHFISNVFIIQQ